MIIVLAAVLIAAVAAIWAISTVNGFKRLEIKVDEALSGIEVALEKRYDMLTKLIDTAKGYMKHETETFTDVIELRNGMSVKDLSARDREMSELSGRLFAVAENYPELRSSEVFKELSEGIRDAEEHLQAARRVYNSNVREYNTDIAMFPAKLLADGRAPKDFYEAEEIKRQDVSIDF